MKFKASAVAPIILTAFAWWMGGVDRVSASSASGAAKAQSFLAAYAKHVCAHDAVHQTFDKDNDRSFGDFGFHYFADKDKLQGRVFHANLHIRDWPDRAHFERQVIAGLNDPKIGGMYDRGGGYFVLDEETQMYFLVKDYPLATTNVDQFIHDFDNLNDLSAIWLTVGGRTQRVKATARSRHPLNASTENIILTVFATPTLYPSSMISVVMCVAHMLLISMCATGCAQNTTVHRVDRFIGKDLPLQQAIDADDVAKLRSALQEGADVNAKGKRAVTPLEYAIGHFKKQTYIELLRQHADPNQRNQEGDNAVTLAVRAYAKDPEYLVLALKSGGDPNTRKADADPILGSFKASHNVEAIKLLATLGADINIRRRDASPLIVDAALTEDWDVVWCLLELGAKFDYSAEPFSVQDGFRKPKVTPPDSPLYKYKVQSWQFLTAHGLTLPPLQ